MKNKWVLKPLGNTKPSVGIKIVAPCHFCNVVCLSEREKEKDLALVGGLT